MQKIVIIGAGPAGLLLAHYLLARGRYHIELYDRRPDPRQVDLSSQRTYPISLQLRGMTAIRAIPGLEDRLTERGVWSQGSLMHRKSGAPRKINRKTPLLLIDRNQLVLALLRSLLETYGDGSVAIRFDCPCTAVDLKAQSVTFQPAGPPVTTHFDRLVGADGVRSQVRDALVAAGKLQCEQALIPDAYRSLFVRRTSPDTLAEDRVHAWFMGQDTRTVMAPQPDGWLHGTFVFPRDRDPLASFETAEAVLAYFQAACPSLGQLMTLEEADALRQRPASTITTVRCDRMHVGDRALLIGDAVHAVSPAIGQGCNASLQDAMVFAQMLERYDDDWRQALPAFTAQRLPDVHALRELSDYSFPRSARLRVEFILRLTLGKLLRRRLPQFAKPWLEPLPMELVMDSDLSYATVLGRTQGWIERVKRA